MNGGHKEGEAIADAERFALLLDAMPDACWCELDRAGRIVAVAGRGARLDAAADALVGAPFSALYVQDDVDAGRPELDLAAAVRSGKLEHEGWRRDPGGRRFRAHSVVVPRYGADGALGGFAVVLRDRSASSRAEQAVQESEERYRAICELTSDYAYAFRIDGSGRVDVEWIAGAFTRITGYSLEEVDALGGGGGLSIVHPDDRPVALARLQRLVLGEPDVSEFRIVTKHGDVRWIRESGRPRRDPQTGVVRVFGAAQDVTERKLAEEEARARQAELAHVLRLATMGEMAAGLAHEINQPLSAIVSYARGCSRRLKSGSADGTVLVEPIEEIARQAMRADEIVQRLLLFVRKQKPVREVVRVDDLVREVVQLVSGEARKRRIALDVQLASGLASVEVDKIQIEQVILNLVRNGMEAMQASAARDGRLLVRTAAGENGTVEVAVEDQGEGLPAGAADRVFEPFFTTKRSGLGMGLAISRSIVRGHGGRIEAVPNPDRGVTFRFTLPAASEGGSRCVESPRFS